MHVDGHTKRRLELFNKKGPFLSSFLFRLLLRSRRFMGSFVRWLTRRLFRRVMSRMEAASVHDDLLIALVKLSTAARGINRKESPSAFHGFMARCLFSRYLFLVTFVWLVMKFRKDPSNL